MTAGRRTVVTAALVALGTAAFLAVQAHHFDPGRFHIQSYFVDQGGYVSTARQLVDTGELRNGVVYPAFLRNPDFRPYMPGHYWVLAASYAAFGFGVFQSLLPNLVAFVLTSVSLFVVGERLYGRGRGLLAALLFAAFPANLLYAFTCMAESTFTGAGAVAFAAFVLLPARIRPWATPVLLVLPFLFRETGALHVVPMALFLLHPRQGGGLRAAAGAFAGSVLALFLVNAWQLADGKGAVPMSWVVEGRFNYTDAFPEPAADLSVGGWSRALAWNLARNVRENGEQIAERPEQVGVVGLGIVLGLIGACVVVGVRRWRRDPLPLAAGLLGVTVVAMIYLLYDVKGQKALRSLVFTFPYYAVAVAGALPALRLPRGKLLGLGLPAALLLGWAQQAGTAQAGLELTENDHIADTAVEALDALHDDPELMIVAPFEMLMSYAVHRYPVQVAFVPSNDETLALIAERWEIGTLILYDDAVGVRLSAEAIHALGLIRYPRKLRSGNQVYAAYQRR